MILLEPRLLHPNGRGRTLEDARPLRKTHVFLCLTLLDIVIRVLRRSFLLYYGLSVMSIMIHICP